jgi:hypothetical protein
VEDHHRFPNQMGIASKSTSTAVRKNLLIEKLPLKEVG